MSRTITIESLMADEGFCSGEDAPTATVTSTAPATPAFPSNPFNMDIEVLAEVLENMDEAAVLSLAKAGLDTQATPQQKAWFNQNKDLLCKLIESMESLLSTEEEKEVVRTAVKVIAQL